MIPESFIEDAKKIFDNQELGRRYNISLRTVGDWRRKTNTRIKEVMQPNAPPPLEPQVIPAPLIHIRPPRKSGQQHQEQIHGLILSDIHAGRSTPSYSPETFRQRLNNLYDGLTLIQSLQTLQHPIRKLAIFDTGDDVQGENVGYQMDLDEFIMPVFQQVYDLYVPAMTEFLVSLLQVYDEIDYYGVIGNHGKPGKKVSSRSTNWDGVAQRSLSLTLANYKKIHFHLQHTEFYQIVQILNWRYFVHHGDVIKMNYTMPWYGLDRKSGRWALAQWPIHAFISGHVHSLSFIEPLGIPIVTGGTFVSDDSFAFGAVGVSGNPQQFTFGIHPERPISWMYKIELDRPKEILNETLVR